MDSNGILKTIIDCKDKRELSDEEWAKFLGVSWGGWSRFKNGSRKLTNNFLAIVAAKCPEIQLEIFQFMRERGGDGSGE